MIPFKPDKRKPQKITVFSQDFVPLLPIQSKIPVFLHHFFAKAICQSNLPGEGGAEGGARNGPEAIRQMTVRANERATI
ncbi:hypothetical protein [Paenibacillus sp. 32O-W]|uniref:hypothetical protein n=1 Tax=Paenibacillus sp. 32O-W TaxID=1695218 RepID=UPI000AD17EF2|nr:hypothetical protein [Paenibacillus sp. 32O-W]